MGRTGRPTVIGVAAAHLCRCKVNVCSCIYYVLAAATNTPYSDNTAFASAYAGGSLPSVFTQLWESRVVSAKGMFAAVVLQLQVFAAATVRNCGIDCQWLLAGRSCSKGRLTKGYTVLYRRGSLFWGPPLVMMSWCLMSSDVIWHIRDKLWPMPKHGSVKSTYVRCMRV